MILKPLRSTLFPYTTLFRSIGGSGYIDQASEGDEVWIILKETPFYAESGGQVADKGIIFTDQASATVIDVQKAPHGQHIHQIKVDSGTITKIGRAHV